MYSLFYKISVTLILLLPLAIIEAAPLQIGIRDTINKTLDPNALLIVQEAAVRIGEEIIFREYPTKRSLKLANEGILDGEIFRHSIIELLYPSLVRVNEPIGEFEYWVWVKKDTDCMDNIDSLKQLKPVGIRGVKFYETLVYPTSQVGYEEVNYLEQVLKMLALGRADYTVHSRIYMHRHISNNNFEIKTCFDKPLFSLPFYLYLHESKRSLVEGLAKALKEVKYEQNFTTPFH